MGPREGVNWIQLDQRPVAGTCEHGKETCVFVIQQSGWLRTGRQVFRFQISCGPKQPRLQLTTESHFLRRKAAGAEI